MLRAAFRLSCLEQLRTGGMQYAFETELLDGSFTLVVRIDLDQRFRPVAACCILAFHCTTDVFGRYGCLRALF